jgi:nucleotide-binding universal stress UspA family protein
VRVGHPADVILETARTESPDVIAMGTHGLGGFRKWVLGSTTERVLRRTPVPVLAVPPTLGAPNVSQSTAAPLAFGRIVAATDFSDTSRQAVQWAAELAQESGVPLLLAHVVEPVLTPPRWRSYLEEADETRVAHPRVRLKELASEFSSSVPLETDVSLGRPADSIVEIAEGHGAGQVVMGLASGKGALSTRPGSIAYRVLCLAKVPVLVVPPHSPDTPMAAAR